MHRDPTVFIVDDDELARHSVRALVRSMATRAACFPSAEAFLADYKDGTPGCLVTDVRMLGMSGLELQEELNQRKTLLPVIVLTAHARTPLTVQAMRAGAVTLLEKPYDDDDLWDAIRQALAMDSAARIEHQRRRTLRSQFDDLAPSHRQVLDLIIAGKPNKAIAATLDLSIRTIENRRREIFDRLDVKSTAELVRMAVDAGLPDNSDRN